MSLEGLPHSGIFGSKPVCGSPKLFAAYHALHRLLAPRHSPYALSSLTIRTLEHDASGFRLQPTACEPIGPAACSLKPAACRRCVPRMHTACVWSENYRCKVFSCQRAQKRIVCFCSNTLWSTRHRRPASRLSVGALARSTFAWLATRSSRSRWHA
jgi:hypothetical protein